MSEGNASVRGADVLINGYSLARLAGCCCCSNRCDCGCVTECRVHAAPPSTEGPPQEPTSG